MADQRWVLALETQQQRFAAGLNSAANAVTQFEQRVDQRLKGVERNLGNLGTASAKTNGALMLLGRGVTFGAIVVGLKQVYDGMTNAANAAQVLSNSMQFLATQSGLAGIGMEKATAEAKKIGDAFGLSSGKANELTGNMIRLLNKAGQTDKLSLFWQRFGDAVAGAGGDISKSNEIIQAAIAGSDEALNRIGLDNPGEIYKKWSAEVARLTGVTTLSAESMNSQQRQLAIVLEFMSKGQQTAGAMTDKMQGFAKSQADAAKASEDLVNTIGAKVQPVLAKLYDGFTRAANAVAKFIKESGAMDNAAREVETFIKRAAKAVMEFGDENVAGGWRRVWNDIVTFTFGIGKILFDTIMTGLGLVGAGIEAWLVVLTGRWNEGWDALSTNAQKALDKVRKLTNPEETGGDPNTQASFAENFIPLMKFYRIAKDKVWPVIKQVTSASVNDVWNAIWGQLAEDPQGKAMAGNEKFRQSLWQRLQKLGPKLGTIGAAGIGKLYQEALADTFGGLDKIPAIGRGAQKAAKNWWADFNKKMAEIKKGFKQPGRDNSGTQSSKDQANIRNAEQDLKDSMDVWKARGLLVHEQFDLLDQWMRKNAAVIAKSGELRKRLGEILHDIEITAIKGEVSDADDRAASEEKINDMIVEDAAITAKELADILKGYDEEERRIFGQRAEYSEEINAAALADLGMTIEQWHALDDKRTKRSRENWDSYRAGQGAASKAAADSELAYFGTSLERELRANDEALAAGTRSVKEHAVRRVEIIGTHALEAVSKLAAIFGEGGQKAAAALQSAFMGVMGFLKGDVVSMATSALSLLMQGFDAIFSGVKGKIDDSVRYMLNHINKVQEATQRVIDRYNELTRTELQRDIARAAREKQEAIRSGVDPATAEATYQAELARIRNAYYEQVQDRARDLGGKARDKKVSEIEEMKRIASDDSITGSRAQLAKAAREAYARSSETDMIKFGADQKRRAASGFDWAGKHYVGTDSFDTQITSTKDDYGNQIETKRREIDNLGKRTDLTQLEKDRAKESLEGKIKGLEKDRDAKVRGLEAQRDAYLIDANEALRLEKQQKDDQIKAGGDNLDAVKALNDTLAEYEKTIRQLRDMSEAQLVSQFIDQAGREVGGGSTIDEIIAKWSGTGAAEGDRGVIDKARAEARAKLDSEYIGKDLTSVDQVYGALSYAHASMTGRHLPLRMDPNRSKLYAAISALGIGVATDKEITGNAGNIINAILANPAGLPTYEDGGYIGHSWASRMLGRAMRLPGGAVPMIGHVGELVKPVPQVAPMLSGGGLVINITGPMTVDSPQRRAELARELSNHIGSTLLRQVKGNR